jgi:hypothetical protein
MVADIWGQFHNADRIVQKGISASIWSYKVLIGSKADQGPRALRVPFSCCLQIGRHSRLLISLFFRLLHPYYWPVSAWNFITTTITAFYVRIYTMFFDFLDFVLQIFERVSGIRHAAPRDLRTHDWLSLHFHVTDFSTQIEVTFDPINFGKFMLRLRL